MSIQYPTTQHEPSPTQAAYIMLLKGGDQYEVTEQDLFIYKQSYPNIDVEGEIRKMIAWCFSNESKRKTKRGIKRFINSWLNAAKPSYQQVGVSQRDHAKQTTIQDRIKDLSWADGI